MSKLTRSVIVPAPPLRYRRDWTGLWLALGCFGLAGWIALEMWR